MVIKEYRTSFGGAFQLGVLSVCLIKVDVDVAFNLAKPLGRSRDMFTIASIDMSELQVILLQANK